MKKKKKGGGDRPNLSPTNIPADLDNDDEEGNIVEDDEWNAYSTQTLMVFVINPLQQILDSLTNNRRLTQADITYADDVLAQRVYNDMEDLIENNNMPENLRNQVDELFGQITDFRIGGRIKKKKKGKKGGMVEEEEEDYEPRLSSLSNTSNSGVSSSSVEEGREGLMRRFYSPPLTKNQIIRLRKMPYKDMTLEELLSLRQLELDLKREGRNPVLNDINKELNKREDDADAKRKKGKGSGASVTAPPPLSQTYRLTMATIESIKREFYRKFDTMPRDALVILITSKYQDLVSRINILLSGREITRAERELLIDQIRNNQQLMSLNPINYELDLIQDDISTDDESEEEQTREIGRAHV
jgi:hypothetical protein